MPRRIALSGACALVAALALAPAAHAQDDDVDGASENCISTSRIRSTEVVDDRTILFYMRNRDLVYLNELPHDCPRLDAEGRFSYRARGGRLCRVDTIRVLEDFGGLREGAACRLGDFVPITRAAAADIEAGAEAARRGPDVEAEQVELPSDEDGGGEAAEDGGAQAPDGATDE